MHVRQIHQTRGVLSTARAARRGAIRGRKHFVRWTTRRFHGLLKQHGERSTIKSRSADALKLAGEKKVSTLGTLLAAAALAGGETVQPVSQAVDTHWLWPFFSANHAVNSDKVLKVFKTPAE
jgi:hypothetical protein